MTVCDVFQIVVKGTILIFHLTDDRKNGQTLICYRHQAFRPLQDPRVVSNCIINQVGLKGLKRMG